MTTLTLNKTDRTLAHKLGIDTFKMGDETAALVLDGGRTALKDDDLTTQIGQHFFEKGATKYHMESPRGDTKKEDAAQPVGCTGMNHGELNRELAVLALMALTPNERKLLDIPRGGTVPDNLGGQAAKRAAQKRLSNVRQRWARAVGGRHLAAQAKDNAAQKANGDAETAKGKQSGETAVDQNAAPTCNLNTARGQFKALLTTLQNLEDADIDISAATALLLQFEKVIDGKQAGKFKIIWPAKS